MSSCRARISVQAVRSGMGQVLVTLSQEASGLNTQKYLAAAKSLEEAGDQLGNQLAPALTAAVRAQSIDVKVHQIKEVSQLKTLQDSLNAVTDVQGVFLRNFSQGEGLLSVSGRGVSGDKVVEALAANKNWHITQASPSSLDVTIVP